MKEFNGKNVYSLCQSRRLTVEQRHTFKIFIFNDMKIGKQLPRAILNVHSGIKLFRFINVEEIIPEDLLCFENMCINLIRMDEITA